MNRTAWIGLVVLATTLAALTPAAAQSRPAQVEPPIELVGAEGTAETGTILLSDGSTSVAASVQRGAMDVWTLRIPCFDQEESACVESSSSTSRRSIDASGGTVSITPREGDREHRTGILPATDTKVRFATEQGRLHLVPEDEQVSLVDDRRAPQGMRQLEMPRGAHLAAGEGATINTDGAIDIVSVDSIVSVQVDADNQTEDERVVTGWSWERAGDGVQWYHVLRLVRADLDGALVAAWDGPAMLAAETPIAFTADEATVDVHEGQLGDASAEGSNTTLEDLEATVTGIRWNRAASTDVEHGPSHHRTQQSAEGPVGWFLVEQGVSPAPPPEPSQDDELSDTTVYGASAAALLAVGMAAYYWPRLSWLGTIVLLPLYSRIEKDELFENEVREELYEIIQDDPGIHAHALSEAAEVGWGTTVYHLRRLERNGFVTSEKRGRYRRFFPAAGFMARHREVLSVLQNETTNAIARTVLKDPGLNQTAICEALDISPSLANWHLNRLLDAELVERERRGRTVHYTPGSAWEAVRDAVDLDVDENILDEAVTA